MDKTTKDATWVTRGLRELIESSPAQDARLRGIADEIDDGVRRLKAMDDNLILGLGDLAERNERWCDELCDLLRDAAKDYKRATAALDYQIELCRDAQAKCWVLLEHDAATLELLADCGREARALLDERDGEWVRLPADADGHAIHVGDLMEAVPYGGAAGGRAEVVCMLLNSDGWVVSGEDPHGSWRDPSILTRPAPDGGEGEAGLWEEAHAVQLALLDAGLPELAGKIGELSSRVADMLGEAATDGD